MKANFKLLLICASLTLCGVFYSFSLEKGTSEEWIQERLPFLSYMLVLSVFFFLLSISTTIFATNLGPKKKISILMMSMILITVLFMQDRGNTVTNHGAYNILCFLMISVPSLIIMFSIRLCWGCMEKTRCFAVIGVSLALGITFPILRFAIIQGRWVNGVNGSALQPIQLDGCTIEPPTLNWPEFLPYRAQNFWAGSTTCSPQKTVATYSTSGILDVFGCEDYPIKVSLLPRTDNFTLDMKKERTFQHSILQRVVEFSFSEPISLDAESLVVECGPHRNVLIRNVKDESKVEKVKDHPLNVLVLYFDAVSRRHFYRRFPKTVSLLNSMQQGDSFEVFQFFRYSSLGINTMKNAPGMFLGTPNFHNRDLSPIWEKYTKSGYITASIDNSCIDWGAKFQKRVSTMDHQFVAPFCLDESHPLVDPHSNFRGPFSIRRRCMSGKYVHQYSFDYLKQFWKNYEEHPRFAISSWNEGHEGTSEVIGLLDKDVFEFLDQGYKSGAFNNTAVFLVSDHGLHFGAFFMLETYAGRIENKLPLLDIILPSAWLKENQNVRESLEQNQQALMTGPDLHETWSHLMNFPNKPVPVDFGKSILERLPLRNCTGANMDVGFCPCA